MIQVIKDIDKHNRLVYDFTTFDFNVVFTGFEKQEKPAKKRKWVVRQKWSVHFKRDCTIDEPVLPEDVMKQASDKAKERISVMTFKWYKRY